MSNLKILESNLHMIKHSLPNFELMGLGRQTNTNGPHPLRGIITQYTGLMNYKLPNNCGVLLENYNAGSETFDMYMQKESLVYFVEKGILIPDWCKFNMPEGLKEIWEKINTDTMTKRTLIL